jgi:hypothetical protein
MNRTSEEEASRSLLSRLRRRGKASGSGDQGQGSGDEQKQEAANGLNQPNHP